MHPGIGLNPDFVLGMRNHGNALEAMLIYVKGTWDDLSYNSNCSLRDEHRPSIKPELVAAGYNSNPSRLPSYLARGGTAGARSFLSPKPRCICRSTPL
ncbi:MAG: hypothetical protein WKF84_15915 [Pyrinomonadaceae bacterium]